MTAHVRQQILDTLRKGNTKKDAHSLAGISSTTFSRWQADNEEFRADLICAQSEALQVYAEGIAEAGKTDWRARAWLLERLDPENWSARYKIEHSGNVKHSHEVTDEVADILQDQEVRDVLERAAQRRGIDRG